MDLDFTYNGLLDCIAAALAVYAGSLLNSGRDHAEDARVSDELTAEEMLDFNDGGHGPVHGSPTSVAMPLIDINLEKALGQDIRRAGEMVSKVSLQARGLLAPDEAVNGALTSPEEVAAIFN